MLDFPFSYRYDLPLNIINKILAVTFSRDPNQNELFEITLQFTLCPLCDANQQANVDSIWTSVELVNVIACCNEINFIRIHLKEVGALFDSHVRTARCRR